eukprot:gnl/MRDRNA2_/MRDRNA2_131770_c0_seq1.p1 gnl/MRDRNA2_/MRDRNA2_131770_c0~~gnl/MRDRNA2_/MRDRNA2_131770_c0_seq1.p1  ORF type:complete len:367 (+),score=78.05 gnl/MRDRNA2_/MRDRNA2_131770_c0_seq1:3-1103(+)
MVRLMRAFPELMTMVKGVAAAARSVGTTLSLLIIFTYVCGIIFAEQYSGHLVLEDYFGSIPKAMWSLALNGTFLDELMWMCELLRDEGDPVMLMIFFIFVLISALTILNMLIGVLCQVVSSVAEAEKEKAVISYVKSQLIDVLMELDTDGSGSISRKEFERFLEIPASSSALEQLGVDGTNLLLLADVIFDVESNDKVGNQNAVVTAPLDGIKENGILSKSIQNDTEEVELKFPELLEMICRLRSTNTASVPDIVDLRKYIRFVSNRTVSGQDKVQKTLISHMDDNLEEVRSEMGSMRNIIFHTREDVREIKDSVQMLNAKLDALLTGQPSRVSQKFAVASPRTSHHQQMYLDNEGCKGSRDGMWL